MTVRFSGLPVLALLMVGLSSCSASGVDATGTGSAGVLELAVAETCADGSAPECVPVNGEHLVLPPSFEQAGVRDATVAEGQGTATIEVIFTEDGGRILQDLSSQAVESGDSSRLAIKVGDEIRASVVVMDVIKENRVQMSFGSEESAQEILELIHDG
ncbi:hypothetical protein OK351_04395 [Glutamicibacter sp. MNS18]|uniref:hypothetical protein n=1 Tax=Glutamicibacter sp. MNS18 TaxID=2989817 RepID=UPI00223658C3|nr:hypothetical protein [Glutamicibacter sp. MNS18]MCW4464745.1 hypothetical protein [Glutamicibacter sp. MNS18]